MPAATGTWVMHLQGNAAQPTGTRAKPPQQSRAAGPNATHTGMPPPSRESVSKSLARPPSLVSL